MQYNKHNIQKVNDKKLMRKVKKQWVVLSVSAFASLGAAAFWMLNPDEASANVINPSTTTQAVSKVTTGTSVGRSVSAQQQSTNLDSGSQGSVNNNGLTSSKVSTQPKPVSESDKAQSDWNNGQKDPSDNNTNYKNTYSNSTQGFTDSMNNDQKNIVQSQNNNTLTKPNPQKQDSGYQNGVNQYNQYRSAMNAGASDAYNGSTANTSSQNSTQAKNYYTAAYNGSNDAKTAYSNATKNEGTDDKSYTSYNQWLKDNNKDQTDTPSNNKSNAQAYQQNLDKNLNNSSNISVKTQNGNIQVNNDSSLNSVNNKYPDGSSYSLAYQYGYNYFLANQGAADAKSGKWNGKNSNGYKPSASSSNPYDQAYLGAQAAIQNQVSTTQSGTNSVSISNYSGNGNTPTYQSAYNDVANSTQNGTVYLANATQMDNTLQKNMSNVKSLKLVNDIGYPNTSGYPQYDIHLNTNALDIDGQNHILDITNNSYTMLPANVNTKIGIHNFKTIYGSNYYGPFALDNSGANSNNNTTSSITYSNINYVGSKLLSAYYSNAYINGNVNVDAVDNYISPFNQNIQSQTDDYYGDGNYQENLQVNSMILGVNANYFGNASNSNKSGSTVIQLFNPNSTLTLGKNSTMTLVPTGATSGENSPDGDNAYGINMSDTNPTLNVNEGATLNIFPNTDYGNKVAGIYNKGTININGGKINAEVNHDFASGTNQLINTQGQVNVTNGGNINVKVSGFTSGSSGLIQNSNNINVSNLGNLNVQDLDSSNKPAVNLINGNPVNIYNVGNQGVTLITNGNPSSKFSTGGIHAYTVVVSTKPNNNDANAYYNFNMNNDGSANVVGIDGKSSQLTINGNSLYINSVPSVSFVGPVTTTTDSKGVTTVNGYAKISKYSNTSGNLYIQYAYGNSSNYNDLNQLNNNQKLISNGYSNADKNMYNDQINNDKLNTNDLIPVSFQVPSGTKASNYGIRLRYGVSGVNAVVTNNGNGKQSYTASTEGYSSNGNNGLQESDVQSAGGDLGSSTNGSTNGLSDVQSGIADKKDPTKYQKDLEYTNAYDSSQAGYKYYMDNSNDPSHQENPSVPPIPDNIANPGAFSSGYLAAVKDLHNGYQESLNGNNINGVPSSSDNIGSKYGFAQGQSVLQGISDANNNPNQDSNYSGNAIQNTAYQAAVKAITDGMNSNPMSTNDLNNKPQVYQDSYNMVYKTANDLAKKIANGNVDPSTLSPAQQKAYNNSPQAVSKSTEAAKNPTADSDSKYSGTDNASKAYQGAQAGYANGGTGTMTPDQQKDPIYSKAFNDAQKVAQIDAAKGAQNYANGSDSNNPTEQNAVERAANNYGYQQMEHGYRNDANVPNDSYYQAGKQLANDVTTGEDAANKSNDINSRNQGSNQAQKDAYNATMDATRAGMNGENKPTDLSKQSRAYQDAYNKSYNDAQQKAQQIAQAINKGITPIDTSQLTPTQNQAYQEAKKAIEDATTAAANNPNANNDKYNGTDNASRVYQATKAGYANGGTNTMSPNEQNDPIYSKAFSDAQKAAQDAARNGAQNYANGNNTNNPSEQTPAEKAADAYGYQQAQAGYDAQRTGQVDNNKYNTDPSYQAGVKVAEDVSKGSQEAAQSNNADSNALSTGSSAEKDAYKATKEAYQAAMNGTDEPDNSSKSQAYRDAYDSAYQDAKKQAAAINNGNITSDRLTPGQKAAYDQAQNAMSTAIDDAKNNPDANNDKYSGNDNASKAYQAAKAGYAGNNMDPKYVNDPVYKNEFNKTQSDVRSQAAQAVKDFADGKDNSNINGDNALGRAYNQGYNNMKAGYEGNPAISGNNNDPSYQAGVQMAKDAKAGTTDAYDNPKQGSSYQGSLAKQEAYQATVEANQDASSGKPMSKPNPSDFTRTSRAYQDAYKQAYDHAQQMTKAAAAGQIDKNNLDNQLDRDSYNQGINASQAGYQAAQSGDPSNDSKYNGKGITYLAYQGAHDGFNNGTKDSGSPVSTDPVYVNAYNNAHDAARKYAKSGAQDFAQGTFKNPKAIDPDENDDPNKQDALNKAHDYGYNQAQTGYNDQQRNKDKDLTNSGTPEYNVGAKMAKDSNLGKQFALTGTGDSIANSDIAQRDGYQATINGYQDGANGHKQNLDGHSQAYKDAYEQAYENGQKLAQQGASGKTGDIDLLQNNVPGQKAYAQGISDANNGYQAAASQNGINDDGKHNDINNSNTDKAYQGALAGFKDGSNGVNQPNNSDLVYVKSYNDANQVAQSAIQAGVNEFAHGDDSSTTNGHNDPISMAHNEGFEQAKQGYQSQMSGKADSSNNNPGYLAGVKMAEQYQKAIDNTNNNPGQDGNNDPVSQATRAGTLAGYSDSIHNAKESNIPSQYQNQSKAYQDAYNKAHQEAINNLKAGAEAFNNDSVAPTGNDITSMAKEQGFAAAQDAYKKAQQNSTVTPQSTDGSNYSETYNGASNAFNNALNGNYSQPSSSSDVYNSAYNKAMKEAKQLLSDAAMNSIRNQKGDSSNLSNDMISKLSDLGMNDASKAYQAAQSQNQSYTSNNPNAIDIYDGAKAAFDDIKNGHANASRNGNDLYNASYDKALQEAQSFAQKGADAYSNGQSVETITNGLNNLTSAYKEAIQNGYDQAQAGHDDSMNGDHTARQNNPYYNNEFNNAKNAVNDGSRDAMSDATQSGAHNGDNKLDQAYNGTVDAYKDAGKTPRDISKMPIAYQDAYNQAQADAQKAYADGVDQFNGDQPNDQVDSHGAASIAHNNGYQAAQSIYNQMLRDPNSVDPSNLNPAQKVGYDKAQQSIAGLKDYASGKQPTSTDSNYMSGYNTAKQAVQAAMNDAQNGKPMNVVVPSGMNIQLYNDIYHATYNGYNNGYNGSNNQDNNGVAYDIAYKHAYQQGQSDVPVTPTPQPKVDQKTKPNRNSNKAVKSDANVDQNTNKGILDAINGHKMNFGSTRPYKAGYNLGKEALKGMRAAEYGRKGKRHIKTANDSFYMIGYSGYKNGVRAAKRTLKANKRLSKHDLVGKSSAYVYTFEQGLKAEKRHQHNLGTKQGIAMAKKVHAIPTRLAMTHSAQYVESYIKAYKRTMKRNMPKYVYNVRTIFVHKQLRFTNKNRVVRYAKMPRYKAKLLRVTGIAYYKNGIPRYRVVGGGMIADKRGTGIVAANDSIMNAYYRHNFNYFRVIKPKGTLTYKGMKFTKDNASHKVYHGEIFKVDKVVKYHGLTRFYLGHGQYVTSNKTIVQKV